MTERAQYVALFFFVHFLFSHIDTGYSSRYSGLTKRIRQINGSRTKTATGTKGKLARAGKDGTSCGWEVSRGAERIAVDKKKRKNTREEEEGVHVCTWQERRRGKMWPTREKFVRDKQLQ